MPRVTPAEIVVALAPLGYGDRLSAAAALVPRLDRDFTAGAADALLSAISPGPGDDRAAMIRATDRASVVAGGPLPAGERRKRVGRRRSRGGTLVGASRILCVPRSIRHPAGRAGLCAAVAVGRGCALDSDRAAAASALCVVRTRGAAPRCGPGECGQAGAPRANRDRREQHHQLHGAAASRALFSGGHRGGGVRKDCTVLSVRKFSIPLPAWPAFVPTSSSSPRTGAISICLQSSRMKRRRSGSWRMISVVCGRPPPRASGVMSYSTRSICRLRTATAFSRSAWLAVAAA